MGAHAHVTRDAIRLVNRHEELVAFCIRQQQILALAVVEIAPRQARILGDTMLDMHDVIARVQIRIERFGGRGALLGKPPRLEPRVAEELGV